MAGVRLELPEGPGASTEAGAASWGTSDPDSHYHMRRLERAFVEGLPVDGRDPWLDYPRGAAIPWPPYYTLLLYATLAPLAPDAEPGSAEHHAWIERAVASVPHWLGVLTSILVAGAAWRIGGPAAALAAGAYHAWSLGSIAYSRAGNGDHHAWSGFLLAALLFGLTHTLASGAWAERRRALVHGLALGALAGLMLGSWVASLLGVVMVQLVLAVGLLRAERASYRGLGVFGLAFHLAALAIVAPAALSSPWRHTHPWIVVNLSWFHPVFLGLGAAVFVVPAASTAASRALRRGYPWLVLAALLGIAAAGAWSDAAWARGVREGFDWIRKADRFMAGVQESRPLLGAGAGEPGEALKLLGYGLFIVPFAWLRALAVSARRGERALWPWLVAAPCLALQAATQARFTNAFAIPLAVLVGFGLADLARVVTRALRTRGTGARVREALACVLALGAALALQAPSVVPLVRQFAAQRSGARVAAPGERLARGVRELCAWLRQETPAPPDYAVLANWNLGHTIEWVAGRPTVATNFGSYIGLESYVDPARFLLAEDPREAEALLERRRARYVLVTSRWPAAVPDMARVACPDRESELVEREGERSGSLREPWYRTIGAQLMFGGAPPAQAGVAEPTSLNFVRLVHASPVADRSPTLESIVRTSPVGWIWEHVAGARLEAEGAPGEVLSVDFEIAYDLAETRVRFVGRNVVGESGRASLRVPYATRGPNGDGRALGQPTWRFGEHEGRLEIDEADVLGGRSVRVP